MSLCKDCLLESEPKPMLKDISWACEKEDCDRCGK